MGLELDSIGREVGGPYIRLTEERRQKYLHMIEEFRKKYRRRSWVDRRELASVVGRLMFASRAVPAGKCFLYRLYQCLHPEGMGGSSRDYNRKVEVEKGGWMDLKWWEQCLRESDCVRKLRTRTFALERVFTDASNYGYGMSKVMVVPGKGELPSMQFSCGVWRGEVAPFSSNWHELMAIAMSLRHSLSELRGAVVYYVTDNNTACAALRGSVRSPELMKIAREIKLLECVGDVTVESLWLSGKNIIRQGADGASRASPYEGQLGDRPVDHATYSPLEWPCFELEGEVREWARSERESAQEAYSRPSGWDGKYEGRKTFWNLRPRHFEDAMDQLLGAQLVEPLNTEFSIVVPAVGVKAWSKYLKHIRQKREVAMHVEGLGVVRHWLLEYRAGDGRLRRGEAVEIPTEDFVQRQWARAEGNAHM